MCKVWCARPTVTFACSHDVTPLAKCREFAASIVRKNSKDQAKLDIFTDFLTRIEAGKIRGDACVRQMPGRTEQREMLLLSSPFARNRDKSRSVPEERGIHQRPGRCQTPREGFRCKSDAGCARRDRSGSTDGPV